MQKSSSFILLAMISIPVSVYSAGVSGPIGCGGRVHYQKMDLTALTTSQTTAISCGDNFFAKNGNTCASDTNTCNQVSYQFNNTGSYGGNVVYSAKAPATNVSFTIQYCCVVPT